MNGGENLHFDAGTTANPEARERARLFNLIPANLSKEDRLAATVHLLGRLHLARDDSALQGMLPEFSAGEIDSAKERAKQAVREKGGELGGIIRTIEARMTGEYAFIPEKAPEKLEKETLLRLVQKHFDIDLSGEKLARNKQGKSARTAAVFLARKVLGKTVEETATLLGLSPYTVGDLMIDGDQEYDAQLSFYKKIRGICTEAGVPAP